MKNIYVNKNKQQKVSKTSPQSLAPKWSIPKDFSGSITYYPTLLS